MDYRRIIAWFLILLVVPVFGAVGDKELKVDGGKWIWNNNSQTFSIAASASMSESVDYTWPPADGAGGQALITDGSGVLSFTEPSTSFTHDILSPTHTDTTTDAVTRGSIIYGNSTLEWDELVIGAATTFIKSDGTDIAWEAIDLGTDTTGNYVASVATTSPLSGGAGGSEGATLTLTIADADDDGATKGAASFDNGNFDAVAGNVTIVNDGHSHTGSSISGIDISDDTNLAVTAPVTLTDDTVGWNPTLIDAITWSDGSNASNAWTFDVSGTDHTMIASSGEMAFDSVVSVEGLGTGGVTDYDLKVGDTDGTPTYGIIQLGNSCIGRTSFNMGDVDLDGSMIYRNIAGPVTSEIEHVFIESTGATTRFALPKSGVGNATYNSRSMLIAGPAPNNTDYVKVSYWQTNNSIFDNLVCDTNGFGTDLGVQNDLEVEGDIFTDSIKESTTGAGVTFNSFDVSGVGTITATTFTDSTATLTGGNITGMGNITGADVDITTGTGDYLSASGDITLTAGNITVSDGRIIVQSNSSTQLILKFDVSNTGSLTVNSAGDLLINADGGDIDFGNDNLLTSGDITVSGDATIGGHIGLGGAAVNANDGICYDEVFAIADNISRRGLDIRTQAAKISAAYTNVVFGGNFIAQVDSSNTQDWTNIKAMRSVQGRVQTDAASGTITGAVCLNSSIDLNAAGPAITNLYGTFLETGSDPGNTVVNQYGLFIEDQTLGSSLNIAIKTGLGIVQFGGPVVYTPSSTQSYNAGDTITVTNGIMRVQGNGGAVTLTSTPTIADAVDGTILILQGDSDANPLTIQDNDTLAGTDVETENGQLLVLGKGDIATLVRDSGDDKWYEKSRSDN